MFAAFGLEKHWFWVFIYNKYVHASVCIVIKYITYCRIRRMLFRLETVTLPLEHEVEPAVKSLCSSFKDLHMVACKEDIVSDKKYITKL